MENVRGWIENNYGSGYGDGFGYGDGDGFGSGDGSGSGDGYGFGDGYDDGFGDGYGDGFGYGFGDGFGYGDGDGVGYGYGDGSGDGYGFGDGLKSISGMEIYVIDDVPTIIEHIRESVARGFIVNNDLTLSPCYVVKGNGCFAHGETLRKATEALQSKIFESMDPEETISAFCGKFECGKKYPGEVFFEWHHYLTGSCLMGREQFVKNKGLDLKAEYTVDEFIDICKDAYGGDIIKQLKDKWKVRKNKRKGD